jgi:lantibiotic modifying enzyme
LSKNEIEMQRIIMITSLGLANSTLNESPHMLKQQDITQHFDYIREAERIAEILISKMNIEDTEASFINVDCDKNKYWKAIPCDESLYRGGSGIATFFLLLHKKTKKENYLEYYLKLLRTSINQAESMPILGGFGGRLSPIYPMLLEYKEFGAVY